MNSRSGTTVRWLVLGFTATVALAPKAEIILSRDDLAEIQSLSARYSETLGQCRAEDYAELFVPESGYFASGFRGQMAGRAQLIALVESERHCLAPSGNPLQSRPVPAVDVRVDGDAVFGIADLGMAEYQDEYLKTAAGWRFQSRTVILPAEKAAGLDAAALAGIQTLAGPGLGENYEPTDGGGSRLLNAGVVVTVADGVVSGRAYLASGGYRDETYERDSAGVWRVASSVPVAPETR